MRETESPTIVFSYLIRSLHQTFGSVAVLIDEYDAPILYTLHQPDLAKKIRESIANFASAIKGYAEYIHMVFVTGVSAFSKSGLSSGLNNLFNITLEPAWFDVCGYTDQEIDLYLRDHLYAWSETMAISDMELREKLRHWYNGYAFARGVFTVYNPFSLTCALHAQVVRNFWFESATPHVLLHEMDREM